MIVFLAIALLMVDLIFGVLSISQLYATAKQAESMMETVPSLVISSSVLYETANNHSRDATPAADSMPETSVAT